MPRKTSLSSVNKAVRAMILGGAKLRPGFIRELKMSFSTLSDSDVQTLEKLFEGAAQPSQSDETLSALRLKLKRAKGTADRFIPYLAAELAATGKFTFSKSEMISLKAVVEKARTAMDENAIVQAANIAFDTYCSDFDTSYKLKSV